MNKKRYIIDVHCSVRHHHYFFSKNDMNFVLYHGNTDPLEYQNNIEGVDLSAKGMKYHSFPTKKNALKALPMVRKLLKHEKGRFSINIMKYDW